MSHITKEMVNEAIEAGWSEEDAKRGYAIFTSNYGNGATHIERIDDMMVFDSDSEASEQAEKERCCRNLCRRGSGRAACTV